ncbi:MAG TPA: hypothetical protein VFU81_18215 [Thermomicrobiales bacterium]|nr:hypothetical protein [Thermomicrobiales bacterium]
MIGSYRRFQVFAVGFGLALAVLVAPVKVGATDMSGMRPMVTGSTPTSSVQVNVSAIESSVLARVAELRMNLLGR